MLANAQGKATEIRGEGEAEAAKSLTVFQQNPELAIFLFRLNALEHSLNTDRSTRSSTSTRRPSTCSRASPTNLTLKPSPIAARNPPRDLMSQSNTAPATQ